MAEVNPPIALQNAGSTHTAETLRNAICMLMGPGVTSSLVPRGGVHTTFGGSLAVTQNGSPNMSVNVASGFVVIPGSENAKQGGYFAVNDATKNLTIAASDPSNPRIDVVCAKVQDSFYSGVTNSWSLAVVTGTPAASPAVPALPNNALKLAQIAVGAAVTSIVTANITDSRVYLVAPGGIQRVASSTERDAIPAYPGFAVWRTDTVGLQIYNGSSYVDYTPSFSAFVGELRNTTARNSTGTEVICNTVTFTAVAGARYKVTWQGGVSSTINGDVPRLRIRHQSGASLTTGGTLDATSLQVIQGVNQTQPYAMLATISGLTGGTQYTAGGTLQRLSGSGTVSVAISTGDEEYLIVERIT